MPYKSIVFKDRVLDDDQSTTAFMASYVGGVSGFDRSHRHAAKTRASSRASCGVTIA